MLVGIKFIRSGCRISGIVGNPGLDCDPTAYGLDCKPTAFGLYFEPTTFGLDCESTAFWLDCKPTAFGLDCKPVSVKKIMDQIIILTRCLCIAGFILFSKPKSTSPSTCTASCKSFEFTDYK